MQDMFSGLDVVKGKGSLKDMPQISGLSLGGIIGSFT